MRIERQNMKKLNVFSTIIGLLVLSIMQNAKAQDSQISLGESTSTLKTSELRIDKSSGRNLVSVDGFAVLLGGAGLAYDRILTDSATIGFFGTNYRLHSNQYRDNDLMTLQSIGVRTRIFTRGSALDSGLYFGIGLVNTKLRTTVTAPTTGIEGVGEDSRSGFLGSVGYQFAGRSLGQGKVQANVALVGGTGMGAKYDALTATSETKVDTKIKDAVGAEASLGFLF